MESAVIAQPAQAVVSAPTGFAARVAAMPTKTKTMAFVGVAALVAVLLAMTM